MSYAALEISAYSGAPIELYKFTKGVFNWYYTSADIAAGVSYNGNVYLPEVISRSDVSQNQEDWTGAITLSMPANNTIFTPFISGLPEVPVTVQVYRYHRSEPANVITIFTGTIANVNFNGYEASVRCLPITDRFKRRIPRLHYQAQCNWALYSTPCGVNKNSYSTPTVIQSISNFTITIEAPGAAPGADKWKNGIIVLITSGESRFISANNAAGSQITITQKFVGAKAGDAATIYMGCDRTEADCRTKFNNIAKFSGFARVPGRNPFTVGVN